MVCLFICLLNHVDAGGVGGLVVVVASVGIADAIDAIAICLFAKYSTFV